jgi:hypothetical protein
MASIKERKSALFSLISDRSFSSEINQYRWINEFLKSKKGLIFIVRDSGRILVSPDRMIVSTYPVSGGL